MLPYFHQADVFALASYNEGLPGVIIEAMACGLPVVTTDAGGCSDAVIHGVTGSVVDIGDRQAMAEALMKLTDAELRATMGRRARERALDNYSLDAFHARFETILETLHAG